MSQLKLQSLLDILNGYPMLAQTVLFDGLVTYINLIRHLKERIAWSQPCNVTKPPSHLPINIHQFLCDAIGKDNNTMKLLWEAFRWIAWEDPRGDDAMAHRQSEYLLPLFLKFGPTNGIGEFLAHVLPLAIAQQSHFPAFYEFFPPHKTCIDPRCTEGECKTKNQESRELTEPNTYPATVITRDFGAIPCYNTSLYCRSKCFII
jgi:CxC5 like cysteine cluster associated with KDZ transposases